MDEITSNTQTKLNKWFGKHNNVCVCGGGYMML